MNFFQLFTKLTDLYGKLNGKQLTGAEIVGIINRALPFKDCRVMKQHSIGVTSSKFEVSGLYDPELDEQNKKSITIELLMPYGKDRFTFADNDLSFIHWHEMCVDIANVLGHEYIHLHQSRRRHFNEGKNFNSKSNNLTFKENQEYYGNPDEIDAYAFTAACNLIYESVIQFKRIKVEKSLTYRIYRYYFEKSNPEIVEKFIKKTNTHRRRLERQYNETYNKK